LLHKFIGKFIRLDLLSIVWRKINICIADTTSNCLLVEVDLAEWVHGCLTLGTMERDIIDRS
jgi:hypothetical protein